jgi:hypothetical protein
MATQEIDYIAKARRVMLRQDHDMFIPKDMHDQAFARAMAIIPPYFQLTDKRVMARDQHAEVTTVRSLVISTLVHMGLPIRKVARLLGKNPATIMSSMDRTYVERFGPAEKEQHVDRNARHYETGTQAVAEFIKWYYNKTGR